MILEFDEAASSAAVRHAALRAYAPLVLLPDMMRQRLWKPLAERLACLSVQIVAVTPVQLWPDQVVRLYRHNTPRPGHRAADSAWLSTNLFALDGCHFVLLRTSLPDIQLVKTLRQWKGASSYLHRADGDLRGISDIADRCCSVLHTPDDEQMMVRVIEEFLHGETGLQALHAGSDRAIGWDDVERLRSYVPMDEEQHPIDIVARSLSRALTLLWIDLHLTPVPKLRSVIDRFEAQRAAMFGLRRRELQQRFADAMHECHAAMQAVPRPTLRIEPGSAFEGFMSRQIARSRTALHELTMLLTLPDAYDARLARMAVDVLRANSLFLDPWEEHRLTTSLAFFEQR